MGIRRFICTTTLTGAVSQSYQWVFNGQNISGATSAGYELDTAFAGGDLVCSVTGVDSNGRSKSKKSNAIAIAPRADVQPGQMGAPLVSQVSWDQFIIILGAAPNDVGTGISSYAVRFSIDQTNWTEIDIASGAEVLVTGLAALTVYYVQNIARNAAGGTWSTSTVVTTDAAPVVAEAPDTFQDLGWSVADLGTGGDATYTITQMPSTGGSAITDVVARVNGGTQFSLGLTAVGSAAGTNRFTDGVASTTEIAAVNAIGQGGWSIGKPCTTSTLTTGTVSAQTAEFGALTRTLAGGFQPVNTIGEVVPLTSGSTPVLQSGSLSVYTASIVNGRLVFSTPGSAPGAPNGAVLRCAYTGGTVDITISQTANTYHVATDDEAYSILGRSNAPTIVGSLAAGQTCVFRRGGYNLGGGGRMLRNKTLASPAIIRGEGTLAVKQSSMRFENTTNITIENFFFDQPAATGGSLLSFTGVFTGITVQDNRFRGRVDDYSGVFDANTYGNVTGIQCVGGSAGYSFSGTVRRNLFSDVYDAAVIQASAAGGVIWTDNEYHHFFRDGLKIGVFGAAVTAPVHIERNVVYERLNVTIADPHGDCVVQFGGNGGQALTNCRIIQNVNFTTGINSDGFSQGITAFTDGASLATRFENLICVGNIVISGASHHITLPTISGIVRNNLMVKQTALVSGNGNATYLANGAGDSGFSGPYGTIYASNNMSDVALQGTISNKTGNIVLGLAGTTIPYTTAFEATGGLPAATFDEVKTKWASKVAYAGKGPLGNALLTYGNPRDASGWFVDPTLLVP